MSLFEGNFEQADYAELIMSVLSEELEEYGLKKEPAGESISEHLTVYTKDSLLLLAAENGMNVYKSWNKAKLVEHIQTDILESLEQRLLMLGRSSLELIEKMDNEDQSNGEIGEDEVMFYLSLYPIVLRLGFIYSKLEDNEVKNFIPIEVKETIKDMLNNYSTYEEKHATMLKQWNLFEMILAAGINLYGTLTMERFSELIDVTVDEAEEKQALLDFAEAYFPFTMLIHHYQLVDGEIIASPKFVSDDHVRDTHKYVEDRLDGDYYRPSKADIYYYATHLVETESPLYKQMEKLVAKSSNFAEFVMEKIQTNIVMGEPLVALTDQLSENDLLVFNSEKDVMDFAHLYQQLNNTNRLWDNAGYKPSEMSDSDRKVDDLSSVLNSFNLPDNVQQKQTYRPRVTQSAQPIRVEKVGRNEPCPCGSGKKYKKCCWLKDR